MKKIFLLIGCFVVSFYQSQAQSKADDINELLKLVHTEQTAEKTSESLMKMIKGQLGKIDSVKYAAYLDYCLQESKAMAKKIVDTDMPVIYDKLFTQDEIKEYLKFYKTPAGQKMLSSQGDIQKQLMESLTGHMPELKSRLGAKREEMRLAFNHFRLDSIEEVEMKRGKVTDTAFMTFCFNDAAATYKTKLAALISEGKVKEDSMGKSKFYKFPNDEIFKDERWRLVPNYSHDSLTEVRVTFLPMMDTTQHLDITTINKYRDLLRKKYGPYNAVDNISEVPGNDVHRYYWIKGNLRIYLNGLITTKNQNVNLLSITYSDTRNDKQKK